MPVRSPVLLAAVITATFLVYLPGTGGPYLADDMPNLVNNRHLLLNPLSWESLKNAAVSSPGSPYYRPLAMLSFAVGFTAAGSMDPAPAKLINIVLHLCTGLMAYLLARALVATTRVAGLPAPQDRQLDAVALLAAGMWLLHPLFVSTVLYTVQRMSILSAFFVMAGCLFYLRQRQRLADGRSCVALVGGIAAFTALAFLCKENGALLPGFLLLIEITAFRFRFAPGVSRFWRAGVAVMLIFPAVVLLAYLGGIYVERGTLEAPGYYFTMNERLLTQPRALTQYAGWLVLLNPGQMGLYHDDFTISTSLLEPPSTLLSLLIWIAAAAAGAFLALRRQLVGLGILWFLWGHALESSVIPLALVFEHRNYLPGYGLILGFVGALYGAMQQVRIARTVQTGILVMILVALPAFQLHERVMDWSDERTFIIESMRSHPGSALTLLSAAVFLDSHGDPENALAALRQAQRNDPQETALVYAETALHCEHAAERPPDSELERRLLAAARESPRTVTARKQYVEMVKACAPSAASDNILMDVYALLRRDRNGDVAMISHYGIGVIHLHRGEHSEAIAAWSRAVRDYRDGESLRPLLDELIRSSSAD